jgi:hypothetical protein
LRIRIQDFDDQKFSAEIFYFIFLIKNSNFLIPRPPKRPPRQEEKPSTLKREHPALQNMPFLAFFLFLYIILASDLDP